MRNGKLLKQVFNSIPISITTHLPDKEIIEEWICKHNGTNSIMSILIEKNIQVYI